ncbi:MAG TPA: hypothetical protein VJ654_00935 [Noviherbaspirillum sp.]|nr:hypothetical protein [Noviherbaspirillum sp.]
MGSTLVNIYDTLANAENALNALLAAGFSSDCVHLTATGDEAGPAEGNFALEYKDAAKANDRSVFDSLLDRDDINEGLGRQKVVWRGNFLLSVEANDEEQFSRASDIARNFGALDVNEVTSDR